MEKYYVYRFKNANDEIIYVGQTEKELSVRFNNHNHLSDNCYKETKTVEYLEFYGMYTMLVAEKYFIWKWQPKYNIEYKNIDMSSCAEALELDMAKWNLYGQYIFA